MAEGTSPYLWHGNNDEVCKRLVKVFAFDHKHGVSHRFADCTRRGFLFYRCFLGSALMMLTLCCIPAARSRADKPFYPVSEIVRCLRSDGDKFFLLATWNCLLKRDDSLFCARCCSHILGCFAC